MGKLSEAISLVPDGGGRTLELVASAPGKPRSERQLDDEFWSNAEPAKSAFASRWGRAVAR